MFIGEYTHSLDEKGRIMIPVKFRQSFRKGLVITRGLDFTLFLYTKDQWKDLAKKLSTLPFSQKDIRAFARLMIAGAFEQKMDKQGRIIIPEYLSRYSKFQKKIVLAGLYNRIEIWDEDRWHIYQKKCEKNNEKIAEKLGDLGI